MPASIQPIGGGLREKLADRKSLRGSPRATRVAADALRDLIDTVIVTAAADRTVTVEINGHLARLVGHDPFSEGGRW